MKHLRVLALTLLSVAISCSKPENPDELTPAPPVTEEKTYVTISDAKFKTYLLSKFDSDKDGGISDSEALAVKDIDCRNLSIASLSGIRCFINLETLNCSGNELNSLALCAASTKGIVTEGNCSKLKTVDCSGNKITSIEISACSGLKSLNASNNQLTEIDLSGNTSLTNLDVSDNSLTYLDLSGNMSIANVDCSGNEDLKTVTVPEGSSADVKTDEGVTVVEDVDEVSVTGVTLDKTSLTLTEGDSQTLVATIVPENATNKNVSWSSSDESVATVDQSGKVTALKAGSAIITVTTSDGGKIATCTVTVKEKVYPVTGVTLDKTSLTLTEGDSQTLVATIVPENATNKNVSWSSSDESVAAVNQSGKVTALKAGSAIITVTTFDGGKTATCTVTVKQKNNTGEHERVEEEKWNL